MADEETIAELENKIRPRLERLASRGHRRDGSPNTITYEKLASEVGPLVNVPDLSPHDPRLHEALGEITIKSFRRHEILLSVLVVNKQRRMPGNGFFWLAKKGLGEMGFEVPYSPTVEDYVLFRDASNRVHDHYQRQGR